MARVKRGVTAHAKHKKVYKAAKGFYGRRKNNITSANAAVDRSMQHAYVGRKLRKRNFRALWIQRINAAARSLDTTYSKLLGKLGTANVPLNRKMLAEIAITDPVAFQKIASA